MQWMAGLNEVIYLKTIKLTSGLIKQNVHWPRTTFTLHIPIIDVFALF